MRRTLFLVYGSSPSCQGERLLAGPVDAAVVTADGRGRSPRESDVGSGASRGSAPQSRSGRGEGRWPGRGGCGGGGGGGRAGGAASSRSSSSVLVVMQLQVPAVH